MVSTALSFTSQQVTFGLCFGLYFILLMSFIDSTPVEDPTFMILSAVVDFNSRVELRGLCLLSDLRSISKLTSCPARSHDIKTFGLI